jgi:alcohol dehydrogenase class IV
MPYVLAWNRSALEEKMTRLAAYLGLPRPSFGAVQQWILALREQIGIPATLADLGMEPAHVSVFAQQAFDDPSTGGNPLPMTPQKFAELYQNCIGGKGL